MVAEIKAMTRVEASLLQDLARAEDLASALAAVKDLERRCGYVWRPVGDNEANYGLINIGSDPGHALIERVTNAIDAVVEREALRRIGKTRNANTPRSPREAVDAWFGVPGGRVANLGDPAKRQPLADQVVVRLLEGSQKRRPTVAVRDLGVGLCPAQVPKSILSLSGSNKIDKPYLAGAYGQGGSTVLAFSPNGTLFVSRRQPDLLPRNESDAIAVTFARFEELDPAKNKNGRYAYLVNSKGEVASLATAALKNFDPGTLVVHFDLLVEQYAARLTQLTGSLWWLFQNTLFDPVLPFWAEEHRASVLGRGKSADRRTISGNFTRLNDDKRDRVEHAHSVDVMLDHSAGQTSIKANYWVIRQKHDGGSAQPIDAYVDPYHPVSYTYFGQTHGTDERRFIADRLQLPYLAKFLIVQVELDNLIPQARRDLLSSTRDRLKRVPFFDQMREAICDALGADEELRRLNDLRKEQLLSRHSEKDRERMRERFAQLMERLPSGLDATSAAKGREDGGREPSGSRSREPLEPLPTIDSPTFIRIANSQSPLPIRVDRHALIRLESDAPDSYLLHHIHARLTLVSEPESLVALESKSDFRGGRSRLTVRPGGSSKPGSEGRLTVFLLTPDDQHLSDSAAFRIDEAKPHPTAGESERSKVKVPEPIPVYRNDWASYGWDESSVALVAEDSEGGKIYVNADNQHLARLLRVGGYQEKGVARMRNNFVLYVAFYAWAQHVSLRGRDVGLEGEAFENYRAAELDRAAQTVIHSIAAGARLADEE
jgi:hypothetical protein